MNDLNYQTVALATLGCKTNQVESDAIRDLLVSKGMKEVAFDSPADIYIINTCTVTRQSDRKSRQMIRRAKQHNPYALLIVMGCYAQVSSDQVSEIQDVDYMIGTSNRRAILDIIFNQQRATLQHTSSSKIISFDTSAGKIISHGTDAIEAVSFDRNAVEVVPHDLVTSIMTITDFEEIPQTTSDGHARAFIKIQEGCEQYCSYCIIPYARGRVRSRSISAIVDEVTKLTKRGFREFVLTGIHIGSYGKDLSNNLQLIDVIEAIHHVPNVERIRLGSIEPTTITQEFADRLKSLNHVCPHFHLSLQSGSDRTLRRMNRKYTMSDFYAAIDRLKAVYVDPALTTDIIAGFPGETTADFQESVDVLHRTKFSEVHVFPFSKRPGTRAAQFDGQLPEGIKKDRAKILRDVAHEYFLDYRARQVGKSTAVLIEETTLTTSIGYTEHYVKVLLPYPCPRGEIVDIILSQEHIIK